MRRILTLMAVTLLTMGGAGAQIVTTGSDPGHLKWRHLYTDDYEVIFPEGMDSLARVYAVSLERVKKAVGGSIGFVPNQSHRTPMPVVLHAYTASSNGMVAWTPRQMHLYTTPDPYSPQPLPWVEQLTIHESRHVAQMQYVTHGPFRPFYWFTGELFGGAAAALYCGPAFFEGDAVAAETELSRAGRGRSGDFLEYQRVCFLDGDTRNYWRWLYGSQRLYTPDHYRAGYLMMAGMRTVYDAPDFTRRYYDKLFSGKWPFPMFVLQKTVRDVSGHSLDVAFARVCDSLAVKWREEVVDRGPVMPGDRISPVSRLYSSYEGSALTNGHLWSVRSGLDRAAELVCDGVPAGVFSASTSHLKADSSRIWWSEIVRDMRWEMKSSSDIWYCDEYGHRHRLTRGKRYFNPAPCGDLVAVAEYPVGGGSATVELNASDGSVVRIHPAPDSLQVYEHVWLDGHLYAAALSLSGNGIYLVGCSDSSSDYVNVLPPGRCSISDLFSHNGLICFRSDLCGVGELYSLDVSTGETLRLTNTGSGASGYQFSASGDSLYYSLAAPEGKFVYKTASDALVSIPSDFSHPHRFCMAEELSACSPLPDALTSVTSVPSEGSADITVGDSCPYRKLPNAVHFHSWLPCYVNPDGVSNLSFETLSSLAGLGATGLFQNDLGTLYGIVAYHPYKSASSWIHSGELKITYRGTYPVFEASFGISSAQPVEYRLSRGWSWGGRTLSLLKTGIAGIPSVSGSIKIYVPLNFSSGGWSRGLVPQISLSASNSIVNHGALIPFNRAVASVRGYAMQSVPSSCIYPRWGFGLEAGYAGRVGLSDIFSRDGYVYAYGYVPGIVRTHGIRLSAVTQKQLGKALFSDSYASVIPRGFSSCAGIVSYVSGFLSQSRLTMDYALPFAPVDWSALSPVAYVRNFEFYLQGDVTFLSDKCTTQSLFSLGGTLQLRLGNLLWIPYATRVGVCCYWNGGSAVSSFGKTGTAFTPVYAGATFSMDI